MIWGTLMVIPIEESLIYVRPLYLRAQGGRIPELTRVIVAYNNQIVMEPTLEAALARLFGGARSAAGTRDRAGAPRRAGRPAGVGDAGPCPTARPGRSTRSPSRRAATTTPPSTRSAPATGSRYGEELRLLGEVLERMKR